MSQGTLVLFLVLSLTVIKQFHLSVPLFYTISDLFQLKILWDRDYFLSHIGTSSTPVKPGLRSRSLDDTILGIIVIVKVTVMNICACKLRSKGYLLLVALILNYYMAFSVGCVSDMVILCASTSTVFYA